MRLVRAHHGGGEQSPPPFVPNRWMSYPPPACTRHGPAVLQSRPCPWLGRGPILLGFRRGTALLGWSSTCRRRALANPVPPWPPHAVPARAMGRMRRRGRAAAFTVGWWTAPSRAHLSCGGNVVFVGARRSLVGPQPVVDVPWPTRFPHDLRMPCPPAQCPHSTACTRRALHRGLADGAVAGSPLFRGKRGFRRGTALAGCCSTCRRRALAGTVPSWPPHAVPARTMPRIRRRARAAHEPRIPSPAWDRIPRAGPRRRQIGLGRRTRASPGGERG